MKHLLLAAILTLVGCSHVELEYRGDVELDDGRHGSIVYNASYPTGGHQLACILTGIFYGGWCWAYLAMPMSDQEGDIRNDAEDFIERRYDGKGVISYGRSYRLGWDYVKPRAKVHLIKEQGRKKRDDDADEDAGDADEIDKEKAQEDLTPAKPPEAKKPDDPEKKAPPKKRG